MIRVNLLGSKSSGVVAGPGFSGNSDEEAAKKLVTLLIFTVLLYGYEMFNLSSLEDEFKKISRQSGTLTSQVTKQKEISKEAVAMQKEIKEIEEKIEVIRELSKIRLRELKAFDTLQNILPEKVWFNSFKYQNRKLDLVGYAVDDEDLTLFLKALQERPYFSKVILKKATDVQGENGVVKEFNISCNVESGE